MSFSTGKEGASAGAVDEEDFMKAFEDVPTLQVKLHAQHKKMFGRNAKCSVSGEVSVYNITQCRFDRSIPVENWKTP